jgi:hypothetical protein
MGKRYGRQQKRKARAEIERLEQRVSLLRYSGERNRDIVHETARVLGSHFATLDVTVIDQGNPVPEWWQVLQKEGIDFRAPSASAEYCEKALSVLRIPSMRIMTDLDSLQRCMHFKLSYAGKAVGYAIEEATLRNMPKDYAVRRIAENIADHLYEQL